MGRQLVYGDRQDVVEAGGERHLLVVIQHEYGGLRQPCEQVSNEPPREPWDVVCILVG